MSGFGNLRRSEQANVKRVQGKDLRKTSGKEYRGLRSKRRTTPFEDPYSSETDCRGYRVKSRHTVCQRQRLPRDPDRPIEGDRLERPVSMGATHLISHLCPPLLGLKTKGHTAGEHAFSPSTSNPNGRYIQKNIKHEAHPEQLGNTARSPLGFRD